VDIEPDGNRLIMKITEHGTARPGPDLETELSDVADRVGALGGKLRVERIPGDATTMRVEIPCGS
jgi:signal transduction histidine kinase